MFTERQRGLSDEKSEFKENLFEAFSDNIDGMNYEEKIGLIEKLLVDYQRKNEDKRNRNNRGRPWPDEQLRIILESAPTAENCMKYARLFKRGYGSIEQIYRWAATDMNTIWENRPDDAFVLQIKRIAKEVGWRA